MAGAAEFALGAEPARAAAGRTRAEVYELARRATFARLVRQEAVVALGVARRLLGDAGEAEDLVQEAFLRAWRHIERLTPEADARPWFYRILINAGRDRLRRRSVRRREPAAPDRHEPDPASALAGRELLDRVQSAVDLLGLCGGVQSVPGLTALAGDPALTPGVLLALGRIGGETAVEALATLARRPSLQRRVIAALGMTGAPSAVAALERLGTSRRSLCVDAQRALATIPCGEAVEAIVRLDGGRRSHRGAERALREMDRDLVLTTLDTLIAGEIAADEPTERGALAEDRSAEARVVATARRIRHAVGGTAHADAARIALN